MQLSTTEHRRLLIALVGAFAGCRHPTVLPPNPPPASAPPPSSAELPALPSPISPVIGVVGIEGPIPPSVKIVGLPDLSIDREIAAVPAHGADPSVLFLNGDNDSPQFHAYHFLDTLFVPGNLPNGEYSVLDAWDGVSGYTYGMAEDYTHVAGDVNEDGHLDVWFGDGLYLGPFLGRKVRDRDDAIAWIREDEYAVAADFDADGDGNRDVLTVSCCQTGIIRYGPFSGMLPSALYGPADPRTLSWLGDGSGCSTSTTNAPMLVDHLGAGHSAVAIGVDWGGDCSVDTVLYDLAVPPGTRHAFADRLGYAAYAGEGMVFDDVGDVDGDGHPDVVWGNGAVSWILAGPLTGFVPDGPVALEQLATPGKVEHGIGDINGDGVEELLQSWERSWDPDRYPYAFDRSWVILFSPFTSPLVPWDGLELGIVEQIDSHLGADHLDLDGDGLEDLIGRGRNGHDDPDDAGAILIWYGRDLLAAWRARGPPDPPPADTGTGG